MQNQTAQAQQTTLNPELLQLKELLKNKRRRVTSGKIYRIKTKQGKIVPFIPNIHQLVFFRAKMMYNRIVIPKARQLGMSTAEAVWDFDDVLFRNNYTAGIIAETKGIVEAIFRDKVKVLRDNLVPRLKYENGVDGKTNRVVDKNSVNAISFEDTKSMMYVDVTFRGGTLQKLHVSEYGPICAHYPLKADEIKSGSFETVALDQQIVVESTAMGADGDFYNICQNANSLLQQGIEPNALQWKLLFFPRHIEPSYAIE